ncbi:DUF922 domain-containing protein [Algibacter sp. AS12]|uniref:DUF922 domain-containing protein n=1 Tax=Algibacter sp. AS12 TaxID=3135773 RepID=UPI00398AF809
MSKVLLLFICLFCVQDNEPFLVWSDANKLSWKDFKGTPKMDEAAVANTASGITFRYSVTKTDKDEVVGFTTEVFAHFYHEKSWYKKDRATTHILGHEQTHFNITELFARKFRYRISKLNISNSIKQELKILYKTIKAELAVMQKKYDSETDFSRNKEAQASWDVFMSSELEKFSKYASN